jgi:uncharacterized protein involved in outer membrane biogenesis
MRKNIRNVALSAGILIGLLVLVPFLIPLSGQIPKIKQIAQEKLGQPVDIQSLGLALLPRPHVYIEGIKVGETELLSIARISVTPALLSLFSETRVIDEITIHAARVDQGLFALIPQWTKSDGGPTTVALRHVALRDLEIILQGGRLPPLHADVTLTQGGGLEAAVVKSVDRKLMVHLVPEGESYRLEISAKDWQLPAGPALVFEELKAEGRLNNAGLDVSRLDASLYGGKAESKAKLNWKNNWQLSGNLKTRNVEVAKLSTLFAKEAKLSGGLEFTSTFTSRARSADRLGDELHLEGDFNVRHGVLQGLDLDKIARSFGKEGTQGGNTRFEELSGHVSLQGKAVHLSRLNVASAEVGATGHVNISPKKELGGRVEVQLKKTAGAVALPLALSGTTANPSVRPTSGALTGAAVGTAILGPAGTTAGIKAGSALEKLFGGGK